MNIISKYFENRRLKRLEQQQYLELSKLAVAEYNASLANRISEENSKAIIMASDEPWYNLIGAPYDVENPPTEPIASRYEWNDAFIKSLRNNGFPAETPAEVISAWEKATAIEAAERVAMWSKANKKASNEPWVEIVSEEYDEFTKQVSMTLDWNVAFIKMLRANGYSGSSEQEIVDKWFKRLSETIAAESGAATYDG